MELLGGMVVVYALKLVGAAVLWVLTVLVLWRLAKALKTFLRFADARRTCSKCGMWYINPAAKFCRDCGARILKAA
jgi:hypothetical protein